MLENRRLPLKMTISVATAPSALNTGTTVVVSPFSLPELDITVSRIHQWPSSNEIYLAMNFQLWMAIKETPKPKVSSMLRLALTKYWQSVFIGIISRQSRGDWSTVDTFSDLIEKMSFTQL